MAFALCGACLGFLRFNLASPARIFLGDGGSMPIGFAVAATIMSLPDTGHLSWVLIPVAVVLVGLPALDTSLVIVSRVRREAGVFTGGRDHLTHRLQSKLGSAQRVAIALAVGQALLTGAGAALIEADRSVALVGAALLIFVGRARRRFAGVPWMGARDKRNGLTEPRRLRVLRIIGRLNMGGPAHQAAYLSGRRFDTQRYEITACPRQHPDRRGIACRPGRRGGRANAFRTRAPTIRAPRATIFEPAETDSASSGTSGPTSSTPTPPRPASSGRQAALAVRPRPAIVHTYHGHVLEGYFGPRKAGVYRPLGAVAGAFQRPPDRGQPGDGR